MAISKLQLLNMNRRMGCSTQFLISMYSRPVVVGGVLVIISLDDGKAKNDLYRIYRKVEKQNANSS